MPPKKGGRGGRAKTARTENPYSAGESARLASIHPQLEQRLSHTLLSLPDIRPIINQFDPQDFVADIESMFAEGFSFLREKKEEFKQICADELGARSVPKTPKAGKSDFVFDLDMPAQLKTSQQAKSATQRVLVFADDDDKEEESAKAKGGRAAQSSRSRGMSVDDEMINEADDTMVSQPAKKTAKSKPRSRKPSTDDEMEEDPKTLEATRRSTKQEKKKEGGKASAMGGEEEDEEVGPTDGTFVVKKPTRSVLPSVEVEYSEDEEDAPVTVVEKKKKDPKKTVKREVISPVRRSTRAKSKQREEEMEMEDGDGTVVEEPKTRGRKKTVKKEVETPPVRSTRSRSTRRQTVDESMEEEEEEEREKTVVEEPARKGGRGKKQAPPVVLDSEEEEMVVEVTESRSKTVNAKAAPRSRRVVDTEDEDEEVMVAAETKSRGRARSVKKEIRIPDEPVRRSTRSKSRPVESEEGEEYMIDDDMADHTIQNVHEVSDLFSDMDIGGVEREEEEEEEPAPVSAPPARNRSRSTAASRRAVKKEVVSPVESPEPVRRGTHSSRQQEREEEEEAAEKQPARRRTVKKEPVVVAEEEESQPRQTRPAARKGAAATRAQPPPPDKPSTSRLPVKSVKSTKSTKTSSVAAAGKKREDVDDGEDGRSRARTRQTQQPRQPQPLQQLPSIRSVAPTRLVATAVRNGDVSRLAAASSRVVDASPIRNPAAARTGKSPAPTQRMNMALEAKMKADEERKKKDQERQKREEDKARAVAAARENALREKAERARETREERNQKAAKNRAEEEAAKQLAAKTRTLASRNASPAPGAARSGGLLGRLVTPGRIAGQTGGGGGGGGALPAGITPLPRSRTPGGMAAAARALTFDSPRTPHAKAARVDRDGRTERMDKAKEKSELRRKPSNRRLDVEMKDEADEGDEEEEEERERQKQRLLREKAERAKRERDAEEARQREREWEEREARALERAEEEARQREREEREERERYAAHVMDRSRMDQSEAFWGSEDNRQAEQRQQYQEEGEEEFDEEEPEEEAEPATPQRPAPNMNDITFSKRVSMMPRRSGRDTKMVEIKGDEGEDEEMKKEEENEEEMECEDEDERNVLDRTICLDDSDISNYEVTPDKVFVAASADNYGIDDLSSGDETDDDENPRKKVPQWASTHLAKNCQAQAADIRSGAICPDDIFPVIQQPDLCAMFGRRIGQRFQKRTSSACWDSPISNPTKGTSRYHD